MIASSSIERLKSILDVVDVVGSYLELKKNGANFKALCPFHDDKHPSMVVSPSKQIYHCFSCGAGGDSIKFVQEYEKLSYPEAIERLAERFNFALSYEKEPKKPKTESLNAFNQFYKKEFSQHKEAQKYLAERGVSEGFIERFEIGYAPASAKQLAFISSNFISKADALEVGLLVEEAGRFYPRFTERITFAIKNQNGAMVGFGGRTLGSHPAKYINSPQTPLFNKSKLLYGYHLAKDDIFKKKEIVVVEGYLDVIMLHQAGITNCVAVLGTALTKEHLPLLKRGEPKVIVAFDGDTAGEAAAMKSAELLALRGFDGGVVLFMGGVDPADMVKSGRSDELTKLIRHRVPFIKFVIEKLAAKFDITNPLQKEKAFEEVSSFLKQLSPVIQEEYKEFAALTLKVERSFFKAKTEKNRQGAQTARYDESEISMIKSLLVVPAFVDIFLESCSSAMCAHHRDLLELVLSNDTSDERLLKIELDEKILVMSEELFLKSLQIMSANYFTRVQKYISGDGRLAMEEKMRLIQLCREKLAILKSGKLAPLDDFGYFV